jgi:uncharacterized protein YcfL
MVSFLSTRCGAGWKKRATLSIVASPHAEGTCKFAADRRCALQVLYRPIWYDTEGKENFRPSSAMSKEGKDPRPMDGCQFRD